MKLSQVLIKDSVVYGFVKYLSLISAILLTPIYTRLISKESYGIMELYNTWNTMLLSCIPLGMTTAILKYYPDSKNDKKLLKDILGTIFFSLIILSLIYTVISLIAQKFIINIYIGKIDSMITIVYWQCIAIVVLSIIDEYNMNILRSEFQRRKYFIVSVLRFLILTILGFYFVYYNSADYEGFYRASIIAVFASAILGFYYIKNHVNFSFNWNLLKKILKFSIHFVSVFILFQVNNLIDRYLINEHIDLESVGIYSIGARIATMANIIYSSFTLAWYPFAMSLKNNEHLQTIFNIVHQIFIVISLFIFLGIWMFRTELLYIFAPNYIEAYSLILVLLISNIITSASFMYSLGLHFSNKTQYLSYAAFFSVAAHVIFSIITVKYIGINGIALGTLIGSIIWVAYQFYYAQKYFHIKFDNIYFYIFIVFVVLLFLCDLLFTNNKIELNFIFISIKVLISLICLFFIFIFIKNKLKNAPTIKL